MTAKTENQVPNIKEEDQSMDEATKPTIKEEIQDEVQIKEEPKEESKEEANEEVEKEVEKVEPIDSDDDLKKRIIRQVEYYFGNKNLPNDRFMLRAISLDDGWIPLTTMLNFKRLATICSDVAKIAGAVKFGKTSLILLNENCDKIKRNPDIPLPQQNEESKTFANAKTVYVKGFPADFNIDKAEDFFASHGKTTYIKLRKDAEQKFKGSVFVEFEDPADTTKFLELKDVKYAPEDEECLLIKSRNAYFHDKNQKSKDDKNKRRDQQLGVDKTDDQTPPVPDTIDFEKGRVIKITGLEGVETSREAMKELFEGHKVTWVTYNKGDVQAHVRFDKSASEALAAVMKEDKFVLSEKELTAVVIEGEEESQYWTDSAAEKAAFYQKNKRRRAENNRGGRGGFRGKRRRNY